MDDTCDLIYFSLVRWDEIDQGPLARAARYRRVFFVEEPVYEAGPAFLVTRRGNDGVTVVQPGLPLGVLEAEIPGMVRDLIEQLLDEEEIEYCTAWFAEPRPPWFADVLAPTVVEEPAVAWDLVDAMGA